MRLAEFQYKVWSRPGREHHCADYLSRVDTPAKDESDIPEDIPCLALSSARGWMAPAYHKTDQFRPVTIKRLLEAQAADKKSQDLRAEVNRDKLSRFMEEKAGLLVRAAPYDGATQVYVPEALRKEVMYLEHDSPQAGHPGIDRMYASIRRHYYWETMANDVYGWVDRCVS